MSKGVVMEVRSRRIVLLTPEGNFVTCNKGEGTYEIGSEIQYTPQDITVRRLFLKPVLTIAACIVLFILFYRPEDKVMAYVSIDITPNLEASVTNHLYVKDLKAHNQDGERILKEIRDWKGKPLQEVLQHIFEQSEKDGYLIPGKKVTLTSVLKDKSDTVLENQLEKLVKHFQDEYKQEDIMIIWKAGKLKIQEEMKKEGFRLGPYVGKEYQKKDPFLQTESSAPYILNHSANISSEGEMSQQTTFPKDSSSSSNEVNHQNYFKEEKKQGMIEFPEGEQQVVGNENKKLTPANPTNKSNQPAGSTVEKIKNEQNKEQVRKDSTNEKNKQQEREQDTHHNEK
ncbi:anti-sigma factor domain-containing protein [Ectobacillus sp. sgz5001026]|uniref:anti-sigma factor domain-containing protein n=1 Tax=Ectobacillus sp. sgz5001026 TaxID=3242473 RepID=UPI0036D2D424